MNSDLRNHIYKRNMQKKKHLKDRSNHIKLLLCKQPHNNVTGRDDK